MQSATPLSWEDHPPHYDSLDSFDDPPEYTPSIHHLSLIYYADESNLPNSNSQPNYIPLLFEINSTQINFYNVKKEYTRYIAYTFNDLNTNFVDPNLNIKSKNNYNPSKLNFIGHGIGSSTNLFNIPNDILEFNNTNNTYNLLSSFQSISTPPPHTLSKTPSSSSSSSSSNSMSSMFSSTYSTTATNRSPSSSVSSGSSSSQFPSSNAKNSFTKFLDKFSLKKSKSSSKLNSTVTLTDIEKKSQDLLYIQKLLNFKPDINLILDTEYSPQEAQLLNFKSDLFKSFSLQELSKFGNASDFHSKPFTLRLLFPTEQFLMVSYNANQFATIFYKLNIARELSLDLNLRVPLPVDYCVPRRSRGRRSRNRNRNRSNSNNISTPTTFTTSPTTDNRSRSNSLLDAVDGDDDNDDEFDTTFNINNETQLDYQPQSSCQPQIILEDEILNDIIQLEPAQQVVSSLSTVSRITTNNNSIFSSVERFSSQMTDMTTNSSSLSPISSENELIEEEEEEENLQNLELPPLEKSFHDINTHSKYKELVFAIKCIKTCKNKTLPCV